MNSPLSPEARVVRLFREIQLLGQDFPTDDQLIDLLNDVEYDTLNYPRAVAERHGMKFTWRGQIARIPLYEEKCPHDTDGDGNCPIHPKGCS